MPSYTSKSGTKAREIERLERIKAQLIQNMHRYQQIALEGRDTPDFNYYMERAKNCSEAIADVKKQIRILTYTR